MWSDASADIKCTRGDCAHSKVNAEDLPCRECTCNRKSDAQCKTFSYKPTRMPVLKGAMNENNK